jgi:serine/threonine-protein kinase RsbW
MLTVRLEFTSAMPMLDLVQAASDHVTREAGLDDEAAHWVGIAVRESVINAITHGNQDDSRRRVFVRFEVRVESPDRRVLAISVRDEGAGFDLEDLADPLAPENLLKSSGRGIFLVRHFMDDVQIARVEGGSELRMVKRIPRR